MKHELSVFDSRLLMEFIAFRHLNGAGSICKNLASVDILVWILSDMNHILHGCTHVSHCCASHEESELNKALEKVEEYVSRIVRLANPRSLLFLGVDGVGPRAKMNQQRTRRFLAVHTRKLAAQLGMMQTPVFHASQFAVSDV